MAESSRRLRLALEALRKLGVLRQPTITLTATVVVPRWVA
jgi:hypothetical protein